MTDFCSWCGRPFDEEKDTYARIELNKGGTQFELTACSGHWEAMDLAATSARLQRR